MYLKLFRKASILHIVQSGAENRLRKMFSMRVKNIPERQSVQANHNINLYTLQENYLIIHTVNVTVIFSSISNQTPLSGCTNSRQPEFDRQLRRASFPL